VYHLGEIPFGIYCDEALNGYHAYSILNTGKDAYGKFLPTLFSAHNIGFVEPIYIYLTVPIVALFDLSIFSTRLLAALIGALTVLTTYLFVKEFFNRHIALISAFFNSNFSLAFYF